jgi:hypothetical protein
MAWPRWALAAVVLGGWATNPARSDEPLPLDKAWAKARVDGKYRTLMKQVKAPQDEATRGAFADLGDKAPPGQDTAEGGYWVYVAPFWYVWRDASAPTTRAPHAPEQATGPPDTPNGGDTPSAWASDTPDAHDEWLILEYDEAVVPSAVKIYESFAPGAVRKLTLFKLDGTEVVAWSGKDPTPVNRPMGVFVVPIRADFPVARLRIDLASQSVPNWNEIDAVGVVDASGKTRWASAALASSSFGQNPNGAMLGFMAGGVRPRTITATAIPPTVAPPAPPRSAPASAASTLDQKVGRLETDLKAARAEIEALKRQIKEDAESLRGLKATVEELKGKKAGD